MLDQAQAAEFLEVQSLLVEVEAMKVANSVLDLQAVPAAYDEHAFYSIATQIREISFRMRQL